MTSDYDGLSKWISGSMQEKGFHDDWTGSDTDVLFRLALINTEIGESINEVKRHWTNSPSDDVRKALAYELADVAIRVFDLLGLCKAEPQGKHLWNQVDEPIKMKDERQYYAHEINRMIVPLAKAVMEVEDYMPSAPIFDTDSQGEYFFPGMFEIVEICEFVCQKIRYPLLQAIREKMEKNMARPHKYGTPDATTTAQ